MSEPSTVPGARTTWYRSLYWRIAVGLVAFLALMLVAQGALFIYTSDRIAGSMPATSPRRLAMLVASDLSAALNTDPDYRHRRVRAGPVLERPPAVHRADARRPRGQQSAFRRFPMTCASRCGARCRAASCRCVAACSCRGARRTIAFGGPQPFRLGEFAAVFVDGAPVGTVAVLLGRPPIGTVVRELAPTMALVGGSVLIVGTMLIALFVFGPARRRLKQLRKRRTASAPAT